MRKRLRIIIPTFQVAAFVATFAFKLAVQHGSLRYVNTGPLQELIWAVNYPIWIVSTAILNWAMRLPDAWGWLTAALEVVVGVVLFPSVPLLWYWVVAEVEMRWHGRSTLRFSGWGKESVALALLMLIGGRALYDAYYYRFYLPYQGFHPFTAGTAQRASWLIVMAWGIALTGLAVHELAVFIKRRVRGTTAAISRKQE